MTVATSSPLTSGGVELDASPEHFGTLANSNNLLGNPSALHDRITHDGYLFLPGLLKQTEVLAARREVLQRLATARYLQPNTDPMDALINPDMPSRNFQPDLAKDNAPLHHLLYQSTLMNFFHEFLGGPIRHFDYTWFRAIAPGKGTPCHVDSVYMNRGTSRLFTTWIPMGDVDLTLGGLLVLEGSNNNTRLRETYGSQDVDAYCENRPDAQRWGKRTGSNGWLMGNVNQIRQSIVGPSGRWLTAEFKTGDALIFTIHTVHCSLDNRSPDRIRLSSDSRYQLASEPADERWIGENPPAHGPNSKRGKIC